MLKVLLAYRCSDEGKSNPFERVLPVGLGYIHAYLRSRGMPSALANFSAMGRARIREILLAERPDIVGLSTFTFNRSATLELARMIKRVLPRAKIILGGPHPTHVGAPILARHPEVDACVLGEGEMTLDRFIRTLSSDGDPRTVPGLVLRCDSGSFVTGAAEPIANLDALPFPALYAEGYGVEPRAQYPYVVTSRGCPARCSFCSSPEFWGRQVRFRSAANILEELTLLRNRFGILYVSFRDDIFALNKKRVIDLCRGMIERRLCLLWDCQTRVDVVDEERLIWMKRAGAIILQYGIESGSQAILDRLKKGQRLAQIDRAAELTRRVGLVLSVYLISGVAGETEQDLRETEEMIGRIRPHDGIVTPLAVFPGTSLWEEFRAERQVDDRLWEEVGHDGVFARPDRFTEEAILRLAAILDRASSENAYGPGDFDAHRTVTGECYATDLLEGESLERAGDTEGARAVYGRLAAREPFNPWPFFRLGRLALAANDPGSAQQFLLAVTERVPEFSEARALEELALERLGKRPETAPAGGGRPRRTPRSRTRNRGSRGFQSYPPPPPLGSGDLPY